MSFCNQAIVLLLCSLALLPPASAEPATHESGGQAVNIGSRLELFVDDYLIESMNDVELRLHSPRSAGKVFSFDQAWEGNTSLYVTVLQDGDRYRLYYRGSVHPDYVIRSRVGADETVPPAHDQLTAYAESTDGIHWTRPSLGLYEFNGSKDNSIIWMGEGAHNFAPFIDGNPAAPASERYKAVAGGPLIALKSADGIRWEKMQDEPIISDGKFDSQNVAFWDGERNLYVAVYRDFTQGVRTIKTATSKDFLHWTPGEWADFGDAPPEQLYTNATVPYFRAPHIYLAFPKRFMPWRALVDEPPHGGISESVFMSSRDGQHWNRFLEAFIRPGRDPRNWVHRTNAVSRGLAETAPGEISLYVARHYTYPTNHLERMVVRTDGFVSVHAGYHGGELVTKPLIFEGGRLVLNYSTSAAGSVRVEVQDADGDPIPGFALEHSPVIYGDEIEGEVQWQRPQGRTDRNPLARLAEKPVRLRFVLRDADLYSMRFAE